MAPSGNTHLLLDGGHKVPTPARLEEACHERLRHAWGSSSKRAKNRGCEKINVKKITSSGASVNCLSHMEEV